MFSQLARAPHTGVRHCLGVVPAAEVGRWRWPARRSSWVLPLRLGALRAIEAAPVARGVLAPLPSSRESGLPADLGRIARTGPAVPVPGSAGNLWRGVKDGRADRISRVGQYPAHARPRKYGHRLRQAGGSAACPAGSRTAVRQWDAAGLSWT